jgi:hypothetical protein
VLKTDELFVSGGHASMTQLGRSGREPLWQYIETGLRFEDTIPVL